MTDGNRSSTTSTRRAFLAPLLGILTGVVVAATLPSAWIFVPTREVVSTDGLPQRAFFREIDCDR